eukprot:756031-Hanusia_phi.AAC.1
MLVTVKETYIDAVKCMGIALSNGFLNINGIYQHNDPAIGDCQLIQDLRVTATSYIHFQDDLAIRDSQGSCDVDKPTHRTHEPGIV